MSARGMPDWLVAHALAMARAGAGGAFSKENTQPIRDMVVFSSQSVVRDPPFSRMDLISCRNLLIYLNSELQGHVIPIFHYALKPGGFLFLGTSENIAQHADLFAPLDKRNRVFERRGDSVRLIELGEMSSPGNDPLLAWTPYRLGDPRGVAWRHNPVGLPPHEQRRCLYQRKALLHPRISQRPEDARGRL